MLEDDEFKKDWASFRSRLSKVSGVLASAGAAATAFGGAVTFAFSRMVAVAAEAESGYRRFSMIFGDNADMMSAKLQKLSEYTGFAMTGLVRQASAFGAIFSELGETLGPEQFTDVVAKAQKAVVDLTGIAGISSQEAADRIKSALTSTGESVDQYGFNLRQAEINQELMRLGINKNVRQLGELEKQLVKIAIIEKSIERGQLDFANMSSTLAARIAILTSNLEELFTVMVSMIMPVIKGVVRIFNFFVKLATTGPFKVITAVLGGLVATVGALSLGFGALTLAAISIAGGVALFVNQLIVLNTTLAFTGGLVGAIDIVLAGLSVSFAQLTASIVSATMALRAFLVAAGPLALIGLAAGGAATSALFGGGPKKSSREDMLKGRLSTMDRYAKQGGNGRFPAHIYRTRAAMLRDELFQMEQASRGAPGAAAVATGIQGTRMISQQTAFAAGAASPDAQTAQNTSDLLRIARQVVPDGKSVKTESKV